MKEIEMVSERAHKLKIGLIWKQSMISTQTIHKSSQHLIPTGRLSNSLSQEKITAKKRKWIENTKKYSSAEPYMTQKGIYIRFNQRSDSY